MLVSQLTASREALISDPDIPGTILEHWAIWQHKL